MKLYRIQFQSDLCIPLDRRRHGICTDKLLNVELRCAHKMVNWQLHEP